MTDDLAALRRLDRAVDDLVAPQGAEAAEPRDQAEAGLQPEGEPTVDLGGASARNGAPTRDLNGAPTAELNGHRPARGEAEQSERNTESLERSRAVDELAATAAELRAAVPAPAPEAAARGRDAFLEAADQLAASQRHGRRRRLLLRASALAAALVLVGVPAALARQALPGSPLYPVRDAAQDARVALAPGPVSKARLLLAEATGMRDAAIASGSSRDGCIRAGRAKVEEALAKLRGVSGPAAEAQWVRANNLLDDFRDLAEGKLPGEDHSGPGGGGDRSGGRGSDDPGGDRHGGSGSGSTSGGSGSTSGDDGSKGKGGGDG